MSNENPVNDPRVRPKTSFGIIYPVGYLVAGYPKTEDARQVQ